MNFLIQPNGPISAACLQKGLISFEQAAEWIKQLPYGRNADKENRLCVWEDGCGTCSTKHALLKTLCDENNFTGIELVLGMYKMSGINTPKVYPVLQQYQLDYLPEAHNYLRIGKAIIDCTSTSPFDFENDLLETINIEPHQIGAFKVAYHQHYLKNWLAANEHIPFTLQALWAIREKCIAALSK